jgi:hypothetical protein
MVHHTLHNDGIVFLLEDGVGLSRLANSNLWNVRLLELADVDNRVHLFKSWRQLDLVSVKL